MKNLGNASAPILVSLDLWGPIAMGGLRQSKGKHEPWSMELQFVLLFYAQIPVTFWPLLMRDRRSSTYI